MNVFPPYLFAFAGAFLCSLALTPVVRRVAIQKNFIAQPKADRWHKKPTALLGGVGIYLSLALTWLVSLALGGADRVAGPLLPLVAGATAMFLLGLYDDLYEIRPQHKLVGQIIIASLVVIFGFQLSWFESKTINVMVSIFWIVGITNAFNLLDNMDGLSAGIAFLAGLFLFLNQAILHPAGDAAYPAILLLAVFLGAVLGFWIYNFHPASIFMGDSGSLLIGFVLAVLTTQGSGLLTDSRAGHLVSVLAVPLFILFIPILDTVFVSVMRKVFRRPISRGGQDHSSHRLVAIGFTEKTAVLALYIFAVLSGFLAMAMAELPKSVSVVLLVGYLLLVFFFWLHLAKVKVYEEPSILSGPAVEKLTPIFIQVTYKKRLFEVLLDLVLIPLAYWTSYLIRFEGKAYDENFVYFLMSFPVVLACQIFSSFLTGVYRGIWQFVGMRDVIVYAKAVTLGVVLSILGNLILYRFMGFSRTLFLIYWMILILFMIISRFSYRLLGELTVNNTAQRGKRALIYGAGSGGQLVAQEIEKNGSLGLTIVGFIDDDPRKQNCQFMGYPVLGGREHLAAIVGRQAVSEVVISFRDADRALRESLKRECDQLTVNMRRLTVSID